jgi:hypothetical protein
MEKQSNNMIAMVMIMCIVSQAIAYAAIDRIIDKILTKQDIIITVSDNRTESVEIGAELGQNEREAVEVVEITTEEIEAENGAILSEFRPSGILNPAAGVNYYGYQKETYYNLPMDVVVMYAKQRIDGMQEAEPWIRDDGCKMLGDYIMIAANQNIHPYGSLVETSLGTGIVVDTGGFAITNPNQVDIAVNW